MSEFVVVSVWNFFAVKLKGNCFLDSLLVLKMEKSRNPHAPPDPDDHHYHAAFEVKPLIIRPRRFCCSQTTLDIVPSPKNTVLHWMEAERRLQKSGENFMLAGLTDWFVRSFVPSMDRWIDWSFDWLIVWSIVWSIDWLIDWFHIPDISVSASRCEDFSLPARLHARIGGDVQPCLSSSGTD